jgi:hypothetical protein
MKEIKPNKKQESGQIIVLLAISLLVLIMVSALAVDGGMIYSERRFAQNAADASSLAGGGAILNYMETKITVDGKDIYQVTGKDFTNCTDKLITDAIDDSVFAAKTVASNNNISALDYLGKYTYNINGTWTSHPNSRIVNGINENYDMDANHGIVIYCNPIDKYIDTQVKITSQVSTSFAHLIFSDELVTTNIAISRARPRVNVGLGAGLLSLCDNCPTNKPAMEFTGTGDITIIGSGARSFSTMTGSGNVEVIGDEGEGGGITLADDEVTINGGAILSPEPYNVGVPPSEMEFPDPPPCNQGDKSITNPFEPGNYKDGISIQNGTWHFNSGTYCINGDLSITGGTVTGYGVTFYMIDGDVKITGNANVRLTATYDSSPMAGMLIYMDEDNAGLITLVGTNESLFTGTILAPTGRIEAGGTTDGVDITSTGCTTLENCQAGTFSVQMIGWTVKVVGTSKIDIFYDESLNNYIVGKMHLLQ